MVEYTLKGKTYKTVTKKEWRQHDDDPCDHWAADKCFCRGACSCHWKEKEIENMGKTVELSGTLKANSSLISKTPRDFEVDGFLTGVMTCLQYIHDYTQPGKGVVASLDLLKVNTGIGLIFNAVKDKIGAGKGKRITTTDLQLVLMEMENEIKEKAEAEKNQVSLSSEGGSDA